MPSIARLIQGLLIPPYDYVLQLHDLNYEDVVDAAYGFRTITELTDNVLAICDAPLADTRAKTTTAPGRELPQFRRSTIGALCYVIMVCPHGSASVRL